MNKYESALKQVCLQCKTSKNNCNKNKCVRYNNLKELVSFTTMDVKDVITSALNDLSLSDLKYIKRAINETIKVKTLIEQQEKDKELI